MISAYPQYKVSSIKWIDELPHDWEELNAQYLLEKKIGNNVGENWRTTQLLSLTQKGVIKKDINDGKGKTHSDYSTYQTVEKGDLVFCLFDMDETPRTVGLSSHFGMITSAYSVFVPKKGNDGRYLYYFYEFVDNCKGLRPYYTGLRKTVRAPEFLKILIPKPPLEHQQYIANFLDRETARIDKLIAEKQTFIKLLKEKRQALISHVVTKGLNPNVKMKDSGIEWIGEVPEHWGHGKIKHIARISNGATPNRDTAEFWEGGTIAWLNSSKVNDVYIEHADQFITEYALQKTSVQPVKPNDLVMAITGEGQTRGRVAICKTDATINQHLVAISISSKDVHVEYLFYWLTSQYSRIRYESSGAGSTKGAITCTDVGLYPLPMPPFEEQKFIVEAVKQKLCKYDSLMDETDQSIKLLQEHRTALISAAVTGKIDVRNQ